MARWVWAEVRGASEGITGNDNPFGCLAAPVVLIRQEMSMNSVPSAAIH
jgi:hypothetical protein